MIKTGLKYSLPFLLIMIGISVWAWGAVGDDVQIVMQWGLDGSPNRYAGSRLEGIFLMPAIAVGMTLLLTILPSIDPRGKNLKRSSSTYLVAWLGVMILLTFIHVLSMLTAAGIISGMGSEIMPTMVVGGVSILLILIGNVLGKARPNWFVGVRTPWTLSSDLSWDKTHRLTGRLMVLGGFVSLGGAIFLTGESAVPVLIAGSAVPALIGIVYSYFAWKSDPDRVTENPDDADI
jgi:uncharacterized membrane protein